MALELNFPKLGIVKRAEYGRQAAEGANQPELGRDDVVDETKPRFLCKVEAILCFVLHIAERVSGRDKIRVQIVAAIRRKSEVTNFVRGIEGTTHQIATSPDMPRPRH